LQINPQMVKTTQAHIECVQATQIALVSACDVVFEGMSDFFMWRTVMFNEQSEPSPLNDLSILKFGQVCDLPIVFAVESPLLYYTHFIGKQYLCCGEACPACVILSRRHAALYLVYSGGQLKMLEVGVGVRDYIDRTRGVETIENLVGSCWFASKKSMHDPVKFKFAKGHKKVEDRQELLMPAAAKLFGMPDSILTAPTGKILPLMVAAARDKLDRALATVNVSDTV
jgi:hypothetical protein